MSHNTIMLMAHYLFVFLFAYCLHPIGALKRSNHFASYRIYLLFEFLPHIPHVSQEHPQEQEVLPFFLLIIPFITIARNNAATNEATIIVGQGIAISPYFLFLTGRTVINIKNARTSAAATVPKIFPPAAVNHAPN